MVNYKKHNIEILIRFVFQLVILRIQQSRVRGRFCLVGCFDSKLMIYAPYLLFFCCIGPILTWIPFGEDKNHLLCPAIFIGLHNAKALNLSTLVVKIQRSLLGVGHIYVGQCELFGVGTKTQRQLYRKVDQLTEVLTKS